jgi:ADP-ribose pyrophosphatase YjhB (NUDIX family)
MLPMPLRLRPSVRALLRDEDGRVLLCRIEIEDRRTLWLPPGGGIEDGESPLDALHRELREELGIELRGQPLLVWEQRIVEPAFFDGFDGVAADHYLVNCSGLDVPSELTDGASAEGILEIRWWTLEELAQPPGDVLFGPRSIAELLKELDGADLTLTAAPLQIGL